MTAQKFAALGDPTRVAIVDRLSRGPATVTEIAAPFDMSLRGVLKHVQILEDAGLVQTEKTGRARRCALRHDQLGEMDRWMQHVRDQWDRRMDRMDALLKDRKVPT